MLICSKCGKDMTSHRDETIIGVDISLVEVNQDAESKDFAKKQFGKYYKEGGTNYLFCYECWIDSLMGV